MDLEQSQEKRFERICCSNLVKEVVNNHGLFVNAKRNTNSSVAGYASQTPVIPKQQESIHAIGIKTKKLRSMEMICAGSG